jgi:hypothetical protein
MILYLNIILTIIALFLGALVFSRIYTFIIKTRMTNHINKLSKENKINFRTFDFRQIPTKLSDIKNYLKNNK